jgi:predicted flap endonuclease-1-like 5' DNA nuclease
MFAIASEITICLLLAALIGFALGYIVAKGTSKKSTNEENPKEIKDSSIEETKEDEEAIKSLEEALENIVVEETIVEKTVKEETLPEEEPIATDAPKVEISTEGIKPSTLEAVKEGKKKDKLSQIKGIGPKLEEKLNKEGIFYFDQIANWSDENIQWLQVNTSFAHRAKKDLWVSQAKFFI